MKRGLAAKIAQNIVNDYLRSMKSEGNQKLPTQKELEKRYFVSRTTIIKALDILREDNIVYSIQGNGTFFTDDRLSLYLNGIYSYDYQLLKSGIEIENELLSSRVCHPNEEVARNLGLTTKDYVIEIVRKKVDASNNRNLILQCNYLNYSRFKNLDTSKLNNQRLYSVLGTDFNLRLTNAKEKIMVSPIDKKYYQYLDTRYGTVMKIDRVSYEENLIVEYTHTFLLVNSFKYDINLNLTNPLF